MKKITPADISSFLTPPKVKEFPPKFKDFAGVNIWAQIMKLFPHNFRTLSAFPYKSSLISLFIETFPL